MIRCSSLVHGPDFNAVFLRHYGVVNRKVVSAGRCRAGVATGDGTTALHHGFYGRKERACGGATGSRSGSARIAGIVAIVAFTTGKNK